MLDTSDDEKFRAMPIGAFEEVLRDRGWIKDKSVRLERRVVGTQTHLIPSIARIDGRDTVTRSEINYDAMVRP